MAGGSNVHPCLRALVVRAREGVGIGGKADLELHSAEEGGGEGAAGQIPDGCTPEAGWGWNGQAEDDHIPTLIPVLSCT